MIEAYVRYMIPFLYCPKPLGADWWGQVCGVKLACTDCNACVCEDCYNPTDYPHIVQGETFLATIVQISVAPGRLCSHWCSWPGNDWHCEYCRGTVSDISSPNSTLNDLNNCLTCAYFGKEAQTHITTLCECNLSPARPTRDPYAERGDGRGESLENPWTMARKKRQSTDITAGTSDDQSITKRIRLENTTAITRYGENSKSCTII